MVVSLVYIKLDPLYVVKVPPLQSQNFAVFVEKGIFPRFFWWFTANTVESGPYPDSLFRRIYTNFSTGEKRAL